MAQLIDDEDVRIAGLLSAQASAVRLFETVEAAGVIRGGSTELEASDAIKAIAAEQLGVTRHWHKRIVRSGPNTLEVYRENPPNRVIEADDIVFLDFGPIFEEWEADFGRTYVLGDDPRKLQLCADLPILFDAGRAFFNAKPDVTGEQLFHHVVRLAEERGWIWGGSIAGHIVGQFPHEAPAGDDIYQDVAPGSDRPMRGLDRSGRQCHWILEIHIVDRDRQFGGFYEQLLDL